MHSFQTRLLKAASLGALMAGLPGTAYAQQTPAEAAAAPNVDEIVVTAQRREQRLQDVPVAVSVVSGAALERSNLRTLEDVSARLPNVKITSGPLVDQINIRGVGSGQNAGFEQSVATFVDGVYRSRSRSTRAALFDVDRVEVLKGPQTTFFGANAIAGALNITTKKPGDAIAYNASALYGFEDGEYNVEAGLTLPASDILSFRVAGRLSGMDGYVDNDRSGDGPHDRSELGRVSMKFEPSADFRSDARFDIGRSRTKNAFPFEVVGCPPPAPFTVAGPNTCGRYLALNGGTVDNKLDYHSDAPYSFANYDFYEGAWTNALQIGSNTLTALTGYFDQKYRSKINPIPYPVAGTVGGYEALPIYLGENYHQFSQELRFQSETGGTFEYMVGGYYSKSRSSIYNVVGFFFLPFGAFNPTGTTNASTPVTGRPAVKEEARTLSAFASATIRPFEAFRINLGARYTSVRKSAVRNTTLGTSANAVPSTYVPFDPVTDTIFAAILGADLGQFAQPKRTDDKFMPSIGIQYDLTTGVMAYASYTRGFKAGGYSAASLADSYGPETVDAYEVGLKGSFFDRRLTLNSALFRSDYKDLQEATVNIAAGGTIISLIRNAAQARSQGVELGASYRFSPYVSLSTDVAYLDAKYRNYPNGACTTLGNLVPTCIQDMSGKRRGYAPKYSGNVSASFMMPIGSYQLRADPTLYFTSKFFESATADPLLEQKGFAKIDLRLGFGPENRAWEIAVIGKNLTDKATAGYRQPVTLAPGTTYAFPDRPRAIAVQFSIKG